MPKRKPAPDAAKLAAVEEIAGLVDIDARILKRELQEEAFRMGLIPYLPQRPQAGDSNDERRARD